MNMFFSTLKMVSSRQEVALGSSERAPDSSMINNNQRARLLIAAAPSDCLCSSKVFPQISGGTVLRHPPNNF